MDISRGTLFHGGGWKKLIDLQVSNNDFKQELHETLNLDKIHNFYGMVEQTGTIYIECEQGYLHAPLSADIIIRRPQDYSIADYGEEGIVQTCSIAPLSYPGHSLLNDDLGVIVGEDDCQCGRKGKYVLIKGRIQHAELRGCSDSYAKRFA
jgi:phenylacetate-coenzyme A ligase PaaK-like adenylate-forming protein